MLKRLIARLLLGRKDSYLDWLTVNGKHYTVCIEEYISADKLIQRELINLRGLKNQGLGINAQYAHPSPQDQGLPH